MKSHTKHSQSLRKNIYINPPPPDMKCEICGRQAKELEIFSKEFCEVSKRLENFFMERFSNSVCVTKYITEDHRLTKSFRAFYDGQVEASWECKDCFSLTNEEALERKYGRNSTN